MTRHLVIYNPAAGRGRPGRGPGEVAAAFRARGLEFDLVSTTHAGHAGELVAERGADHEAVVVVGGDGSLHETIQSLDLERHRLGVIPWGTGNDFAWMLDWPRELDACVARIAAAAERRVDLGLYRAESPDGTREGRFHNNIGLGFEALVNRESHRVTAVKGPALYVLALLRTLRRFRAYPLRIVWEGGSSDGGAATGALDGGATTAGGSYEGPATLIALTNGRRVGGAFLLAPDARIDDGKLDLVLTGRMNLFRLLTLLPRTFRGGHVRSSRVRVAPFTTLTLGSADGIPAYVDGEFLAQDVRRLTVRAEPGVLRSF